MISYAQNFEDVMLVRVFGDRKTGFYVDVGAADPINLSVTKWFYDRGWSGLNIEPNRQLFNRLAADRLRDINLECGAGASVSKALLFEPDVGELSTFDSRIQANALSSGIRGVTRPVAVAPLSELLDRHGQGREIDFLKIDVEGWELEVLKGLDLGRHRPTVLIIEATAPENRTETHLAWESRVLCANYSFVYFDGVNRFYLANERAELKKHFDSPPNVFDNFEPFPLVRAKADSEERLEAMHTLEGLLLESERDRAARLSAIHELERLLQEANSAMRQVVERPVRRSIHRSRIRLAAEFLYQFAGRVVRIPNF